MSLGFHGLQPFLGQASEISGLLSFWLWFSLAGRFRLCLTGSISHTPGDLQQKIMTGVEIPT